MNTWSKTIKQIKTAITQTSVAITAGSPGICFSKTITTQATTKTTIIQISAWIKSIGITISLSLSATLRRLRLVLRSAS